MSQEIKLTLEEKLQFLEPQGWFINAEHLTNSLTGCSISTQSDYFESFVDELYSFFSEKHEPQQKLSNEELLEKYNWNLISDTPHS
tara:strand:- start:28 stop:285 length:258 start_codon:yes stop_codon:yes gene_type:complete